MNDYLPWGPSLTIKNPGYETIYVANMLHVAEQWVLNPFIWLLLYLFMCCLTIYLLELVELN
jgi:hypothetical protein